LNAVFEAMPLGFERADTNLALDSQAQIAQGPGEELTNTPFIILVARKNVKKEKARAHSALAFSF
jgi:hypothetical protein